MLVTSLIVTLAACVLSVPISRLMGRNAGWVLAAPLLVSAGMVISAWDGAPSPGVLQEWYPWMPTLGVGLGLRLDGLAAVFCLLVLGIGAAILCYCTRYLHQGRHGSFYLLMTGFALSMQLLILTDDLVVLFVAWEATTLCSFFLIGRSGDHAREPAIRTLLVTVAGGLALLAAVCIMIVTTGTTSISAVQAHPAWNDQPSFVIVVAVLLAVAAFTKSAQFPFQSWLPDSMVAISPVSAYLHAAAMVKAGIYLLLLFSPVLAGHPVWSTLLMAAGLATALFGATAALRRFDLKELLAYSTMSQLGLLVMAIGVGTEAALTAAVVHTVAHALFKCALFMIIGIIDHQAGTRDLRELQQRAVRLPVTGTALVLAAASMAGLPLLLGFVSKESLLAALVETPGPSWVPWVLTLGAVTTSALTFAYSGRLVLGGLGIWGARPGGNLDHDAGGTTVRETSPAFWGAPMAASLVGLGLGLAPFALDLWVSAAATAASGTAVEAHLVLWHGVNLPLALSATVILVGTALLLARRPVETMMTPLGLPISGLAIVDRLRSSTIAVGGRVGATSGGLAPRAHLMIPAVCLTGIAIAGIATVPSLPSIVGDPTRPHDWLLVALTAVGVLAGIRARTRISALVVIGVVGFAVTLWFFNLGAIDVALTQLLVEILTVCVMVLLLRRLPATFRKDRPRRNIPVLVVATATGLAAAVGVYALTGRREISDVATYLLEETYETTGGSNIVNSILVDFRALDTLGELTVLGLAGLGMAALLMSRRPDSMPQASVDPDSPLAGTWQNLVFIRTFARVAGPLIIILSVVLLFRGHYEPGGGFIGALVGGAGFALLYLSAPTDDTPHIRWPYLTLIGLGVVVGTGTGLVGFLEGSFLAPLHTEVLGLNLSTALIFDVGVYLAVIGVILAAFNLLGRPPQARHRTTPFGEVGDTISEATAPAVTSAETAQSTTTTGGTQ